MRLHTWFGLIVWSGNTEKYTSICYDICQTITTFRIETHNAVSRAKCKKADFSTVLVILLHTPVKSYVVKKLP